MFISTNKFMLFLFLIVFWVPKVGFSQEQKQSEPLMNSFTMGQRLWQRVIWGQDLIKIDITLLPENIRSRAERYIQRSKKFKSRLAIPEYAQKNSSQYEWTGEVYFEYQVNMERAIVSLIDFPHIEGDAAAFVLLNPGCYEWEGDSYCPSREATFAEKFLQTFPDTGLKPYLLLFLMHRYRSITECADIVKNSMARQAALAKYDHYLAEAKNNPDELIQYLADSMDKAPYVYTDQFLKKDKP